MKNYYIAATFCYDGKNLAQLLKVRENENALNKLTLPNITIAQICATKVEAERIVDYWNKCYRNNGTFFLG